MEPSSFTIDSVSRVVTAVLAGCDLAEDEEDMKE